MDGRVVGVAADEDLLVLEPLEDVAETAEHVLAALGQLGLARGEQDLVGQVDGDDAAARGDVALLGVELLAQVVHELLLIEVGRRLLGDVRG